MTRDPNEMEQAVSRTLRDSLEKLQRTAEELNQSVNDLVSACASTRPANALPPMLRAQTSAASLAAALDVLSRFVISALQPTAPATAERSLVTGKPTMERVELQPVVATGEDPSGAVPAPAMEPPLPMDPALPTEPALALDPAPPLPMQTVAEIPLETVASLQASEVVEESVASLGDVFPVAVGGFDISALPAQEQELHRRANRVAKVSMQDIKLLRAEDVRLGQEHRDLCARLRDDLEKAHKEYGRRFQTILGHPVDYFYDWLVAILANGDPQLLGEYPYPSPVLRH